MTDIDRIVRMLRVSESDPVQQEAADALEAQAKETEKQKHFFALAEKHRDELDARIAELETALNGWQQWWGLPWQDRRPDIAERCYRAAAALKGEK
jgi:hypothetical protein